MNANEKLKNRILDEMIKQALENNAEKIDKQYPSNQELAAIYTFSASFEKRMQKLLQQVKCAERSKCLRSILIKITAAVLLFIIMSYVTVMSVEAFRVKFLNYILEQFEDHTRITITRSGQTDSLTLAYPAYLPQGFSPEVMEIFTDSYFAIYRDQNNREISLQQLGEGSTAGINTENAIHETLIINGHKADYYERVDLISLVFKYEGKVFILQSSDLPKEEIIKIAESMRFAK